MGASNSAHRPKIRAVGPSKRIIRFKLSTLLRYRKGRGDAGALSGWLLGVAALVPGDGKVWEKGKEGVHPALAALLTALRNQAALVLTAIGTLPTTA